jgi:hypothetical protein
MRRSTKDQEKPTGPTRDKMEVGWARYQKPGPRFSPWVEEYIGVIGVAVLVAALLAWVYFRASRPAIASPELKFVSGPAKVWMPGGTQELRSVQARVQNTGKVPAEGVVVMITIAGQPYQLPGPAVIAPGQSAAYEGVQGTFASAPEPLSGSIVCKNCH